MTALTPIAAVRPAPRLDRSTFVTSRLMDFCSVKELQAQTGHAVAEWPLVIVKELVDNALDAAEEAGVAPAIDIRVDDAGTISIADNGPGLPAETMTPNSMRCRSIPVTISTTPHSPSSAKGAAKTVFNALPWAPRVGET
jgi:Histidine kinase-, DNA gyrase B-, and HSP90-like ATPase